MRRSRGVILSDDREQAANADSAVNYQHAWMPKVMQSAQIGSLVSILVNLDGHGHHGIVLLIKSCCHPFESMYLLFYFIELQVQDGSVKGSA